MRPEHHRAWVQQAQLDAERGVIACRMCQRHAGLTRPPRSGATASWSSRFCDRCAASHDVVFSPTEAGVEVRQAASPCSSSEVGREAGPSAKRPCRLERGEIRRVPQDRTNLLVGYHVCCLRCGFNTPALAGNDGLDIDEGDAPDDLTFSKALRCTVLPRADARGPWRAAARGGRRCGTSASADRLLVVHEARVAADELVERFLRLPAAKAMNLGTRAGF